MELGKEISYRILKKSWSCVKISLRKGIDCYGIS